VFSCRRIRGHSQNTATTYPSSKVHHLIFSCLNSLDFARLPFRFFIANLLFFSVCLSVASSSSLCRFCRWDGTIDGLLSAAAKGGGDEYVVTGDGAEKVDVEAGDGRVIVASLARQDGIGGANDVGLVNDNGEREGATSAEAAPIPCLSTPLQAIGGSACCFGRHHDQKITLAGCIFFCSLMRLLRYR